MSGEELTDEHVQFLAAVRAGARAEGYIMGRARGPLKTAPRSWPLYEVDRRRKGNRQVGWRVVEQVHLTQGDLRPSHKGVQVRLDGVTGPGSTMARTASSTATSAVPELTGALSTTMTSKFG